MKTFDYMKNPFFHFNNKCYFGDAVQCSGNTWQNVYIGSMFVFLLSHWPIADDLSMLKYTNCSVFELKPIDVSIE